MTNPGRVQGAFFETQRRLKNVAQLLLMHLDDGALVQCPVLGEMSQEDRFKPHKVSPEQPAPITIAFLPDHALPLTNSVECIHLPSN
jgi:hypothetical protein